MVILGAIVEKACVVEVVEGVEVVEAVEAVEADSGEAVAVMAKEVGVGT